MKYALQKPQTLFIGQHCIGLETCESTSSYLAQLPASEVWEGSCAMTHEQTKGRGQLNNSWESEPYQNLTFSCLLKPKFLLAREGHFLTMTVALGITDALKAMGIHTAQIKWPNDLMLQGRKLAGLLIESRLHGENIDSAIVGIGLNINQQSFLTPNAISLLQYTGLHYEVSAVFVSVVEHLEKRYFQLKNRSFEQLSQDYHAQMFGLNQCRNFRDLQTEEAFEAYVEGVHKEGGLLLRDMNGLSRRYFSKEVLWL